MQSRIGVLCLLAIAASHAAKVEVEVTPVQKVVQLMKAMLEKGKKAKQQEQVAFAAKSQFCDDTKKEKTRSIAEEKQAISGLKAAIAAQTAKIAKLTKQIASNQKDVDTWSADVKAATKVRTIEKTEYDKTNKDYGESITALGRAITTLKAKNTAQKASSFLQVSNLQSFSLIPDSAARAIDEFVQQGQAERELFESAPEANAYESQSSGIVDMLAKLQEKFTEERTTLQKEEKNSVHAHALLLQSLDQEITEAKKDIKNHSVEKQKTKAAKSVAESDDREQKKLLAADSKYLKDLTAQCAVEKAEFEAAQQMRSDELVAIDKATEIISSSSVSGKADKHLPKLLQETKAPASFSQLRSNQASQLQAERRLQGRAAKFLHAQAAKFSSRLLETVAFKASADPMLKVRSMIKDLIVKLNEEANAEADHKGFCDTSLGTNKLTRTTKTEEVQTLKAEMDQLSARLSKLNSQIAKLNKQVDELDKAMATSTQIRNADKAKNANTVADSQEAQAAVAKAVIVLKSFYAKADDAANPSFVQEPYTGMENGGILGMLEVIESDFARLESGTKSSEATDQKVYDDFMTDSRMDKAGKGAAVEHKMGKKTETEATKNLKATDLEGTQKELKAALTTFEKLKPSCVKTGVTYEERVARRKEEINTMKEALAVLASNTGTVVST